jgi:tetratricopeptide (TPR) repeat protein
LLAPDLQQFFARLSVFRGGWSVEAAEQVCDEPLALDFLAQLRECSLVLTEEVGGEIRFRLLEMLREYAAERLTANEMDSAVHRHRTYYLDLAAQSEQHLKGPDPAQWLDRLDANLDNFRAALSLGPDFGAMQRASAPEAAEADIASRLSLAISLSRFWSIRGHSREGRRAVEDLLEHAPVDHPKLGDSLVRAQALGVAGSLAHDCGDLVPATAYLDECVAKLRSLSQNHLLAEALNLCGNVALDSNDPATATEYYDEAFALFRAAGDTRGIAMVLSNQAVAALEQEDVSEAARLMDDSLRIKRRLGNPHSLAIAMENLGNLRIRLEEFEAAGELHAEALATRREIGHKQGIAMSLNNLAYVKLKIHEVDAAAEYLSESLKLFHELGDPRGLFEALVGAAGALACRRKHEACASLLGAAGALTGVHQDVQDAEVRRLTVDASKSLGEKRFEKAAAAGRAWSTAEAVERALALIAPESP